MFVRCVLGSLCQLGGGGQQRWASSMRVFDRTSKARQLERAIEAERSKLDEEGFSSDFLRDFVAERVLDRFRDIKDRQFTRVLDIGSRFATTPSRWQTNLQAFRDYAQVDELTLLDVTDAVFHPGMKEIESVMNAEQVAVKRLVADVDEGRLAEYVQDEYFDAVTSSLALHWYNDLPRLFKQIQQSLKPDGVFLGSVYGGSTLTELREAFLLAEQERRGGVGIHVSPMTGVSDVGSLLQQAGFSLLTVDTEKLTVHYPDIFALMEELRGMGESNAHLSRELHLPLSTLFAAAAAFQELHGVPHQESKTGVMIPVVFEVIHFIGWKPHQSQPQPAARGSAQQSLKDL